jgi:hypothetical protein
MDVRSRCRSHIGEGVYVGHYVMSEAPLVLCGAGEINVVHIAPHFFDCRFGNINTEFPFPLGDQSSIIALEA